MSSLQLLKLQRQARQIEREFASLQRQYESSGGRGGANVNLNEIKRRLREIRVQTERELNEKDNTINHLNNVVETARVKLVKIREQVVRESRENSDRIFREHIAKELKSIRSDVVNYENQKQNTIVKLNKIREQIVRENNQKIELNEEISTLKSQLRAKQNVIDNTYQQVKLIKQNIIKESANTTPGTFREHIQKQLTEIRSQVSELLRENESLRRGNTQMNGIEETKEEDSNLIPSSRRIESSDDNIKTQLDIAYYTCYICPWSMRVWLTLLYKNIAFDLKYEELSDKSEEFTKSYQKADNAVPGSTGQVPLIRHNDFYLCESGPLVNYLDNVSNRRPIRRINQRDQIYIDITVSWASNWVAKYFYGMLKCANDQDRVKMGKEYIAKIGELNKRLSGLRSNNPFLLGNTPSIFYFYFFPFFDRMPIVELFYGANRSLKFSDIFTNNNNFKKWYDAAMALPATQESHRLIKEKYNMEPVLYYKKEYTGYIPKDVKVN